VSDEYQLHSVINGYWDENEPSSKEESSGDGDLDLLLEAHAARVFERAAKKKELARQKMKTSGPECPININNSQGAPPNQGCPFTLSQTVLDCLEPGWEYVEDH
jgi:hypothetical protein